MSREGDGPRDAQLEGAEEPVLSEVPLLSMDVDPIHVAEHWWLCGAIADYFALFCLPSRRRGSPQTVSSVINELVENAVKYAAPGAGQVHVTAWAVPSALWVETRNGATSDQAARLRRTVGTLSTSSTETRIGEQAANADLDGSVSGLGLSFIVEQHGVELRTDVRQSGTDTEVVVRVAIPWGEPTSTPEA